MLSHKWWEILSMARKELTWKEGNGVSKHLPEFSISWHTLWRIVEGVFGREKLLIGLNWLRFFPNPLSEIKALQIGLLLPKRAVSQPVDNCLYGILLSQRVSLLLSLWIWKLIWGQSIEVCVSYRFFCIFTGPLSFNIHLIYQPLTRVGKYSRTIITIEYELQMSPCNIQNSGHPMRVFQLISCPCPGYVASCIQWSTDTIV